MGKFDIKIIGSDIRKEEKERWEKSEKWKMNKDMKIFWERVENLRLFVLDWLVFFSRESIRWVYILSRNFRDYWFFVYFFKEFIY